MRNSLRSRSFSMETTLRSGMGDWCLILSVLGLAPAEVVAADVDGVLPLVVAAAADGGGARSGVRWDLAGSR